MVNTGKPSTGCYLCRARRVKCDETKPDCSNCCRLKRQCPGYEREPGVVWRKKTKAQAITPIRIAEPTSTHKLLRPKRNPFCGDGGRILSSHHESSSIDRPISICIEQQALYFFVANYGCLGFLTPLIKTEDKESPFSLALSAVSLAALGNRPNSKVLLPKSAQQYAKALRRVNCAVHDENLATQDSTLAAVVLLGLFEIVTSSAPKAKGWTSHALGGVALVKMRKAKGPLSAITRELLHSIRTQTIVHGLIHAQSPDPEIDWWIGMDTERVDQFVNELNIKVAHLRADCDRIIPMAQQIPSDVNKVFVLMQRAESLEVESLDWIDLLPSSWSYNSVGWVDDIPEKELADSHFFPGRVDRYSEIWTASLWNIWRSSRLYLSGCILRCTAWLCAPLDYKMTTEYSKAAKLSKELIGDIIASVPNFFGRLSDYNEPGGSQKLSGFRFVLDDRTREPASGLYFLWPLYFIATSDFATEEQRKWIVGKLKSVAETMGINRGAVYSESDIRLPSMMIQGDSRGFLALKA